VTLPHIIPSAHDPFLLFLISVEWQKEGKPLEDSSNYQVTSISKTKFQFQVLNASSLTDIGQYTVKVVGKKGEIQAHFALNVTSASTPL